jgi:uncharacterized protein (DUF4415 family)
VKIDTEKATESVWVEIPLCDRDKLLVGAIYRSPSSTDQNNGKINRLLVKATQAGYSHVLMGGDLNHPSINWKEGTTSGSENSIDFKFLETTRDCFLTQHIIEPTHQRNDETAHNTLDLVLTNEEHMVDNIRQTAPLGKSHHSTLVFDFSGYTQRNTKSTVKYLFNKANYDQIREDLRVINWDTTLGAEGIETMWNRFEEKIKETIDKNTPCARVKQGPSQKPEKPPWMNPEVMEKIKLKQESYTHYRSTGEGWDEYVKHRNEAKTKVTSSEIGHEKSIAEQAMKNPKAFYGHAGRNLKTKSSIPDLKLEDGTLTASGHEKVERLSRFFSSVFTQEDMTHMPDFNSVPINSQLANINITEDLVEKKTKALNPNKSPGPDGIHPRFLRETATELASPLAKIFNQSLKEQKVPTRWKQGQITPIFKKGDKSEAGNYRPVSLTSIVSKLMESIVRDKLMNHLDPVISEHQHGFMNGRSCVTQLIETIEEWTKLLDEGHPIDAVYLDFAKAFDTVPHVRLIKKLNAYGVEGNVLGWIEDFLKDRKQRVAIGENVSSWQEVVSGVPQGSVLGPSLFLCYVNDLPKTVKGSVKMFADDTKVSTPIRSEDDQKKLQRDLEQLEKWTDDWQLKFNTAKCKVMHLGYSNPKYTYEMGTGDQRHTLKETTCEKDLGVHVDVSLHISKHCQKTAAKANRILGLVNRSFKHLDGPMIKQLFIGLIRPHLEYGNLVWSPQYRKDATIIENVQRRATRLAPELRELSYEERLKSLNLPSLSYRRRRGDLIETYKIRKDAYKISKDKILPLKGYKKTRGHPLKLEKQEIHLDLRKKFYSVRVHDAWNALPESVINAPSVETFKGRLDKHLGKLKFCTDFSIPLGG